MATQLAYIRTPNERFENLPDYNFHTRYHTINVKQGSFRIHFVDEGDKEQTDGDKNQVVVMLHGEPSWSYLYRHMIPIIAKAGHRVIVPDLLGFGKSDKLVKQEHYTHQLHVDIIYQLFQDLNLNKITLFVQDWGGLIGLRVVGRNPNMFERIVAGNTVFHASKGWKGWIGPWLFRRRIKKLVAKADPTADMRDMPGKRAFEKWVVYSQVVPKLNIGEILQAGTVRTLSEAEIAAYNAPFPDESYKAGARVFPMLVPSELRKNQKVWDTVLSKWTKPFLLTFSDKDPITRGREKMFLERIPATKQRDHHIIENASHFLQEDAGEQLAKIMVDFISET